MINVAILYDSNIRQLKCERMKEKMGSKSAVGQNLESEDNNDSCSLVGLSCLSWRSGTSGSDKQHFYPEACSAMNS